MVLVQQKSILRICLVVGHDFWPRYGYVTRVRIWVPLQISTVCCNAYLPCEHTLHLVMYCSMEGASKMRNLTILKDEQEFSLCKSFQMHRDTGSR